MTLIVSQPWLRRALVLAAFGVGGALAITCALILPVGLTAIPRWFVRSVSVGLLWAQVAAFLTTLLIAPGGMLAAGWSIRRARRARRPHVWAARALVLCISCLLGAAMLEAGAAIRRARPHRLSALSSRSQFVQFEPKGLIDPPLSKAFHATSDDALRLVVIGESSARGEPYHPWLSVGQIVGWQLERVLGRRVEVDIRAEGGLSISQAIGKLHDLTTRPDAILIYAGHNEFQARCSWSRSVAHYVTEKPYRPPHEILLEATARHSSLCAFARDLLEKHRLDCQPPPRVTRELVDFPAFTPREFALWRAEFRRSLEEVVTYSEEIGALPILVIPASNDGDFAPSRSFMAPTSTAAERAAFARDFQAARALENTDPAAASTAFRDLVDRQPLFAEAHYRLARLLDRAGQWEEARHHYVAARDLDGLPLRCPSAFQQAYHEVAIAHDVVLVDSPTVLGAIGRHGILDDHLFHDAQHPNLKSYVALSQTILDRLHARRAFGWPEDRDPPLIRLADCAEHFGMDAARWTGVCKRAAWFYSATAYICHDPAERREKFRLYDQAAKAIAAGSQPEETGLASLSF